MDYLEALSIVPRSLISLIVLFLVTKMVGKKQISELSLFDYVIGISIGNFAAEMVMDMDGQYLNGIVAMITFGAFSYLISILSIKSMWIRRVVIGVPTIIIENGKILEKSMKKVDININDLLEEARISGYFDISEIAFAIMEANGKISFLPKDANKPTTRSDLDVKIKEDLLTSNIIIDKKLMMKNIKNTDKSLEWFKKQLKIKGYKDYDNILLATYKDNALTVYEKSSVEPKDVLE